MDTPHRIRRIGCVSFTSAQVREVAAEAIARARRGDGPTLIEAETYRFRGHSLADPDELRSKEEKEFFAKRDPIPVRDGSRLFLVSRPLACPFLLPRSRTGQTLLHLPRMLIPRLLPTPTSLGCSESRGTARLLASSPQRPS